MGLCQVPGGVTARRFPVLIGVGRPGAIVQQRQVVGKGVGRGFDPWRWQSSQNQWINAWLING